MSADDGYVVGPLDPDSDKWGVWHYGISGGMDANDSDPDSTHNNMDDALQAASTADNNQGMPSEYGVSLTFEYPVRMEGF